MKPLSPDPRDPRQAKTLDEACRNPNGTYNGHRLLAWLSEVLSPGKGMSEQEVREMFEQIQKIGPREAKRYLALRGGGMARRFDCEATGYHLVTVLGAHGIHARLRDYGNIITWLDAAGLHDCERGQWLMIKGGMFSVMTDEQVAAMPAQQGSNK